LGADTDTGAGLGTGRNPTPALRREGDIFIPLVVLYAMIVRYTFLNRKKNTTMGLGVICKRVGLGDTTQPTPPSTLLFFENPNSFFYEMNYLG